MTRSIPKVPIWILAVRTLAILTGVGVFAQWVVHGGQVTAAVLGALAGAISGPLLAHTRLRTWAGVSGALVLVALGSGLDWLVTGTRPLAYLLGPVSALWLGTWAGIFAWAWGMVGLSRFLVTRYQTLAAFEAVALVALVAAALSAHRGGAINRPYLIGDWAASRGIDPADVLALVGALASMAMVLVLVEYRRGLGAIPLLLLLFLAILLVAGYVPSPKPRVGGGEGVTSSRARRSGGAGQGRPTRTRASGRGSQDDLEFPMAPERDPQGEERPVAVVVFHDDYDPVDGLYHFRQVAFTEYNGRRLVRSMEAGVDPDVPDGFPIGGVMEIPRVLDTGATVSTTVAMISDHRQPFGLVSPAEMETTANPDPKRFVRAYRVVSNVVVGGYSRLLQSNAGSPDWSDEVWAVYTALPDDQRYRELAREILSSLDPKWRAFPLPAALAVYDWIRSNVTYSRRAKHYGDDPVASFLFGDRRGYCIHIAHAVVYLLRAMGFPARVAAGYAVPREHRGGGSSVLIRGANAHAWAEIYLRDVGWLPIDPMPEHSEDPPVGPPDRDLQRILGDRARGAGRPSKAGHPGSTPRWTVDPRALVRALLVGLALALAAMYLVKVWVHLSPCITRDGTRKARARALRAALSSLAGVGVVRRHGETRPGFARRVQALAPGMDDLTERCVAARLGSRRVRVSPGERALLTRIHAGIRRGVRWWRLALGYLDPTTWWRAR